jgi:hypothetical protein
VQKKEVFCNNIMCPLNQTELDYTVCGIPKDKFGSLQLDENATCIIPKLVPIISDWDSAVYKLRLAYERLQKIKAPTLLVKSMKKEYDEMLKTIETFMVSYYG